MGDPGTYFVHSPPMSTESAPLDRLRWSENLPFWFLHGVAALLAYLAGWS